MYWEQLGSQFGVFLMGIMQRVRRSAQERAETRENILAKGKYHIENTLKGNFHEHLYYYYCDGHDSQDLIPDYKLEQFWTQHRTTAKGPVRNISEERFAKFQTVPPTCLHPFFRSFCFSHCTMLA